MSKPRVFVSSTYYDLKYVRERIEHFINAYCLEPILFESDNVYFNPNASLDTSCYNEVGNCHLMILIIGGRYGSLATDKESYERQHVSITRREYETAKAKGIPVMIFVEQNVYTEYRTYQTNKQSLPDGFKFAYVDNVKVFEFISALEQNAIKSFNKVDDIEHYFSYQISGMLLTYLTQLQTDKSSMDLKNAVEQINVASKSMQAMINGIAEKIIGKEDNAEYKQLLSQQNHSLIDFFIELFDQNMEVNKTITIDDDNVNNYSDEICEILYETIFNAEIINEINESEGFLEKFNR